MRPVGRKRTQKAQGSNSQRVRQEAGREEARMGEGKGKEGTRVIIHRQRPKNSFFPGKLWRKRWGKDSGGEYEKRKSGFKKKRTRKEQEAQKIQTRGKNRKKDAEGGIRCQALIPGTCK